MPVYAEWHIKQHNPFARPLGCNGKYGTSGAALHRRQGTETCRRCKDSANHYDRERTRGQKLGRPLAPCGTPAAALRHRRNGEDLCLPCKVASAEYDRYRRAVGLKKPR